MSTSDQCWIGDHHVAQLNLRAVADQAFQQALAFAVGHLRKARLDRVQHHGAVVAGHEARPIGRARGGNVVGRERHIDPHLGLPESRVAVREYGPHQQRQRKRREGQRRHAVQLEPPLGGVAAREPAPGRNAGVNVLGDLGARSHRARRHGRGGGSIVTHIALDIA
jgi:hypothetical protein